MSVEHEIAKAVSEDYLALQEENNALKTQVAILRKASILTDEQFRHYTNTKSYEDTFLSDALKKTQVQCLADIRADTIKVFSKMLMGEDDAPNVLWYQGYCISYVQQLRDNGK